MTTMTNHCSSCTSSLHLWSDSSILIKNILTQTVCAFCWVPLSSNNSLVKLSPLVSSCGHMFHHGCLEYKEKMYKDTPTRCPICGYIIGKVRTVHILTKQEGEEMVSKGRGIEEEKVKLLLQIEELKERIGRL